LIPVYAIFIPNMPLTPGTKLGHFEILSQLVKGGMGEMYKARDTRLKCDVADSAGAEMRVLMEPGIGTPRTATHLRSAFS